MKISQKSIDILIIVFLGLVPLLWLRQGYIIAKGDYFPLWFNPSRTLINDIHLWSANNMGDVSIMSSLLLYEIIWLSLRSLGLNVEFVQILLQTIFFMGAGFSMYYLSKTVYPQLKLSPLISSIFYMFNFFVLKSRLNIGVAWTYTFLPLLMALLIKIMAASQQNKAANKTIIYFAIASTISLSFASVNPANVVIAVLLFAILFLYYLITQKSRIRQLLLGITKLTAISISLNLWWIIPILNYYLWSPLQFSPQISVTVWSWTHGRASFLNLFWLNGDWGWRSEHFPYIDSYSDPILIILTFVPFFLAAAAVLFKTNRSRFSAYIMLTILIFLFLAKGLHEPLSQLNLLLYTYIPGMAMFREPTPKFTMALMPFLALLIGYAVHHIADIKIGKHKHTNLKKTIITTFLILTFVISAYPLVTNPIETKTPQLPFSSYIKIPNYWYEAADWLNNQPEDYKILITPPDDFYAMPYTWGYYGAEDFLARLIQKPIILTYHYGYRLNPDIATTLEYLGKTIIYNKTAEFKALLALLNVRYILQRNDIQFNSTGRNIIPPEEMQVFFASQPYIRLAQKFGQLDIYEYTDPKPYIYILDPTTTILNTTDLNLIFPNTTQNQPATILNYRKINPTKITATVNATQPFMLVISEAFNNQWTAYINGKTYKPISLYLCIKGFQINETGLLNITIEYEPQHWFYIGSTISLATILACLTYLAYNYTKNKAIVQRQKEYTTQNSLAKPDSCAICTTNPIFQAF
ncbi:MAG: alpha-(1-_3)-arabinofuranosyltransferase domain-containing protein [Candidatus Bathyarchaeia archaeon]